MMVVDEICVQINYILLLQRLAMYIGWIFQEDSDFGDLYYAPNKRNSSGENSYAPVITKEAREDNIKRTVIEKHKSFSGVQKQEIIPISKNYPDFFSKKPWFAKFNGYAIRVTADSSPTKLSPYRIRKTLQEEVDFHIWKLFEQGVIEPIISEWVYPVICVAKKDETIKLRRF